MAGRNYDRLAIEEFGRRLIVSGDLDPVYIALVEAQWDQAQLAKWLIAYWCFYSTGVACYASEQPTAKFWKVLETAAENEQETPVGGRWPRGHERRHARGEQGKRMVSGLRCRYKDNPEGMINTICSGSHMAAVDNLMMPYEDIANAVKKHTLFGPWISFKICDMVDRVLGIPVSFKNAHVFMFKDPVKAAVMLWRERTGMPENAKPKDLNAVIEQIVDMLIAEYADLEAPPYNDRAIGLQEVETVLCKWKSHMNGHYPINNDIDEICGSLVSWAQVSGAAKEMLHCTPEGTPDA